MSMYRFDTLHPRDNQSKRFVEKNNSGFEGALPADTVGGVSERVAKEMLRETGVDAYPELVATLARDVRSADADHSAGELVDAAYLSTYGYEREDRADYDVVMGILQKRGAEKCLGGAVRYLQAIENSQEPAPEATAVSVDDPRVQAGEVFDEIQVGDTTFSRRRKGVYPDWPYQMRFQVSRKLDHEEMARFASLVGYAYRVDVRGEPMGAPILDSPYSFTVDADTTKTASGGVGAALSRFETHLPGLIANGSPVRTTDRAGAGTEGTRLIEPVLGEDSAPLTFEIYYDSVFS